jgi:hypothetical protein
MTSERRDPIIVITPTATGWEISYPGGRTQLVKDWATADRLCDRWLARHSAARSAAKPKAPSPRWRP